MTPNRLSWLLHTLFGVFLLAVTSLLTPSGGIIGHDYAPAFTRYFIGAGHIYQNGLALPHFTASLCGGLPFFADPQSLFFSIPQWLTLWLDPWVSTLISIWIFYCLAYVGSLKFFGLFGWHPLARHVASLLFCLNGFSFARMYVGHVTHLPYLTVPWFLYLIFRPFPLGMKPVVTSSLKLSLLCTWIFYSGGLHVLILFAYTLLLLLPYLLFRKRGELLRLTSLLFLSGLFFLMATSGKLVASLSYSPLFKVGSIDASPENAWTLILRYFWFIPGSTAPYQSFGSWQFGAWEYIGFLSKLCIPLLLLFLVQSSRWTQSGLRRLWVTYTLYLPLCLIIPLGSELNTVLPFFKSYHNPLRFLASFIPVIVLASGSALNRLLSERFPRLLKKSLTGPTLLAGALLISEFVIHAHYFTDRKLGQSFQHNATLFTQLRERKTLPTISAITQETVPDIQAIAEGKSPLRCYEPLLGYRLERMQTRLQVGSTATVSNGSFNIHHPGCLLYPKHFKCNPWSHIPATDRLNFQRFIEGKPTDWPLPVWQSFLYRFNAIALLLLLLGLPLSGIRLSFNPLRY